MGDGFKGIGLLPDGASEQDFDDFADWNIRGVRLNYVHGGVPTWNGARHGPCVGGPEHAHPNADEHGQTYGWIGK